MYNATSGECPIVWLASLLIIDLNGQSLFLVLIFPANWLVFFFMYVKMGYIFWCRTFHLRALELTLTSFIVFSLVFDGSGGGQELRYGSLANRLLCKPVKIRFLTKRN